MRKTEKETLVRELNKLFIWRLEMKVSRQDRLLTELAHQGVKSDHIKWRKLCYKRNIIRKIMFEKLTKLYNGEIKEQNPTYQDALDYENDKRNHREGA